jgi:amyloid beta precursor protein binding protein 1
MIIACDLLDDQQENLCGIGDQLNIGMIFLRSYGMIGYLRSYKKEHTCIQSKQADKEDDDLRLAEPFEELEKYALEFDMSGLDSLEHGHTPYVVILIKALKKWKDEHDGNMPKNFEEKDAFKAEVKAMARDASKEANFNEAIEN